MKKGIQRPGPRQGYDAWSTSYDDTDNPMVFLDRRHTMGFLAPERGELILDAGCGTGYYVEHVSLLGAQCVGMDFSSGMLAQARKRLPSALLVQADLHDPLPFRDGSFDAVLLALVSEHIVDLSELSSDIVRLLKRGGRCVWSVFHPELARSGIEANFTREGVEYRLGAEHHTIMDYEHAFRSAGFVSVSAVEYSGNDELSRAVPHASKYQGRPMLLMYRGRKP